jgi:hypothetical protein
MTLDSCEEQQVSSNKNLQICIGLSKVFVNEMGGMGSKET